MPKLRRLPASEVVSIFPNEMIGTSINQYQIAARLGAGGMGEVYRATDTRLGREVAIKVLPSAVSHDPQSLARFEREAKALAALIHPHIAAIYGFEAAQGTHFIVLELVEGQTLSERLRRGRLPLKEALPLARQIAEAVEAGDNSSSKARFSAIFALFAAHEPLF